MSEELEKKDMKNEEDVENTTQSIEEDGNDWDNRIVEEDNTSNKKEELSYTFWAESEDSLNDSIKTIDNKDDTNYDNNNETYNQVVSVNHTDEVMADQYNDKSSSSYQLKYADIFNNTEANEEYYREHHGIKDADKSNLGNEQNDKNHKNSSAKQIGKFILSAATFGLIAGVTFVGVTLIGNKINPNASNTTQNNAIAVTTSDNSKNHKTTSVANQTSNTVPDVSGLVEKTMPSIVTIRSSISKTENDFFGIPTEEEGVGSGSGIIVGKNSKELLIATNNHVVKDAKKIVVTFVDNKEITAEVKGTDSTADLAVIAVKLSDINDSTSSKIKIAVLGDSDKVKVGQMAVAIGNALGYGQSVTVGYISAKDREVQISDSQKMVLLQTDAAINPGNSGGALLNAEGEVIGINSAKTADNAVEGMGYAIPISKATPIINDLMNREKITEAQQGYLGIAGADISEEEQQKFNIPKGALVSQITENGPAEKAGIQQGDVITKVGNTEVTTFTQLKETVNSNKIGTELTITFMRSNNGKYKKHVVKVVLAEKPDQSQLSGGTTNQGNSGSNDNGYNDNGGSQDGNSDDGSDGLDDFFNFGN
ncbi:trypsin-like peptidase domain-containing protein [Anaeromicropila herbilytica]|uniref:PDZ domain-containing protein n=1 Tax=Anaeromicropila herbilytica TaxID=2785025 RepID=A0A7R7EJF3_9FIRM|nr:trypsin-like peptidase domain-containing protein [Anaeromicropila herbilytica]BCN29791.1 hypothetical protein bsdtb5_10860 [Anaeromicropila herbilytica]